MKSTIRKILLVILLALLSFACGWYWHLKSGGVSHEDIQATVRQESVAIQARIDRRGDAVEAKLDRLESKLDKLIEMAAPKLPDGMRAAE